MYLVRLTSEEERAVAAFDEGDLMSGEKAIQRLLTEWILLRELVDREATGAASGQPRVATWRRATHWAYT